MYIYIYIYIWFIEWHCQRLRHYVARSATMRNKGRSQAVPVHCMKAYRGSRGVAPLILSLDTKWRRVVSFTPRPLYLQERTLLATEEEACWTPPRFETRTFRPVASHCTDWAILTWGLGKSVKNTGWRKSHLTLCLKCCFYCQVAFARSCIG